MSFALYTLGFLVMLGGLDYGAHLAHVPTRWIVALTVFLLGIGIFTAVRVTRPKDAA